MSAIGQEVYQLALLPEAIVRQLMQPLVLSKVACACSITGRPLASAVMPRSYLSRTLSSWTWRLLRFTVTIMVRESTRGSHLTILNIKLCQIPHPRSKASRRQLSTRGKLAASSALTSTMVVFQIPARIQWLGNHSKTLSLLQAASCLAPGGSKASPARLQLTNWSRCAMPQPLRPRKSSSNMMKILRDMCPLTESWKRLTGLNLH